MRSEAQAFEIFDTCCDLKSGWGDRKDIGTAMGVQNILSAAQMMGIGLAIIAKANGSVALQP
jgi:hypothetical protein